MNRVYRFLLVVTIMTVSASAWALTEKEQAGIDDLIARTMGALTAQESPVFELFSTQGSAAVIGTEEGFVAASRAKLKSKEELAAQFTLPKGTQVVGQTLQRAGGFIIGRVALQVPAPCPVVSAASGPAEGRDLWAAFMDGIPNFYRDRLAAPPAALEAPEPVAWDMAIAALQDGKKSSWRLATMALTKVDPEGDPAQSGQLMGLLRSWEVALVEGNVDILSDQLNDDPLCIGVYTPDGQAFFFTDAAYLTSMLSSLVSMGTAERSVMQSSDIQVSGQVGSLVGRWDAEIPMFGEMTLGMTANFVKSGNRWLLLSLCGGQAER